MTRATDIQVGARVRYRHGGEAWAFSRSPDKVRKVLSIRIVQATSGIAHSVWLRVEGRDAEISLIEVEGVSA